MRSSRPNANLVSIEAAKRILGLNVPRKPLRKFAKEIGLPPTTVANYSRGLSGASVDALATVLAHVPQLNARWLLTGQGAQYDLPGRVDPRNYGKARDIIFGDLRKMIEELEHKHGYTPSSTK